MKMIYMDHNAATYMHKECLQVLSEPMNPSSVHYFGRKAKIYIEEARRAILDILGAKAHKLIFCSSGTEANNTVLNTFAPSSVVISSIEHHSVYYLKGNGANLVSVDDKGRVDLAELEGILRNNKISLISIGYANNETGVIQNIKDISELAMRYDTALHIDAAQAFGKINIDMGDIDYLTISSHKIGGPVGVAAIVMKDAAKLTPMLQGGGQEFSMRAGTQSSMLANAFAAAAGIVSKGLERYYAHTKKIRDYIEGAIYKIYPGAIICAKDILRLPNTAVLYMPGKSAYIQMIKFDMHGICISNGSACSSGKIHSSHVLKAMGIADEVSNCSIRVSLGANNSLEEADIFINKWREIYEN